MAPLGSNFTPRAKLMLKTGLCPFIHKKVKINFEKVCNKLANLPALDSFTGMLPCKLQHYNYKIEREKCKYKYTNIITIC